MCLYVPNRQIRHKDHARVILYPMYDLLIFFRGCLYAGGLTLYENLIYELKMLLCLEIEWWALIGRVMDYK